MGAVMAAELLKLKRSHAALLCAAAPALVALLTALIVLSGDGRSTWSGVLNGVEEMWSYFMLPMAITAFTLLVAQLEHGPGVWDHLLAQPVARWQLFVAKGVAVVGLVAAMSGLLCLLVPVAGVAAELVGAGTQLPGPVPWAETAALVGRMFAGSLCMLALQLWVALRSRSFAPGLALGVGGTLVSGVTDQLLSEGVMLPWLLAQHAVSGDPVRAATAMALGLGGGALAGLLLVLDLSCAELIRA